MENSKVTVTLNSMTDMAFIDYDKVAQIIFIDVAEYNKVFGHLRSKNRLCVSMSRAKKVLAVRLGGWPAYRHFAGKVENFN